MRCSGRRTKDPDVGRRTSCLLPADYPHLGSAGKEETEGGEASPRRANTNAVWSGECGRVCLSFFFMLLSTHYPSRRDRRRRYTQEDDGRSSRSTQTRTTIPLPTFRDHHLGVPLLGLVRPASFHGCSFGECVRCSFDTTVLIHRIVGASH